MKDHVGVVLFIHQRSHELALEPAMGDVEWSVVAYYSNAPSPNQNVYDRLHDLRFAGLARYNRSQLGKRCAFAERRDIEQQ